jgi:hypothetical protein
VKRRSALGLTGLLGLVGLVGGCGSSSGVGSGGSCYLATDCALGLYCYGVKSTSSGDTTPGKCTSNVKEVQPEAAALVDGGEIPEDGIANPDTGAAAKDGSAGDTSAPAETGSPSKDSGGA